MTVLSDYVSGSITLTNGSIDFTGTGTGWLLAGFKEGDTIIDITGATEFMGVIATIDTNAGGKLTKPWEGPTLVDAPYRMRYQPDGSRVSAQARNLIELLGDGTLVSLAGLNGPGVIELLAGGGAQVVPKSDLTSGADYDVQVADLAGRAVYDGQAAGFAVLVSDVGDGRAAIYSKVSNASGDWSDPAYVTGPVGPLPEVEATVTSLPPGSTATVTPTPITGGVRLDFDLPGASGFYNAGVYSIASPYNQDDVVRFNGSSFIALQTVPVGESPSSAFPPIDTPYWAVLAAKGQDGTGTGDVVGPAGATAKRLVVFGDATGKLLEEASGLSAAQQRQARIDIGTDGGVGNFRDLRGTVFETGVPSDYYDKGTVFGMARGGADGLGIPGLPNSTYGVLRAHGQYSDASAAMALQREFFSALGAWRQYATSSSVWSAWFRMDGAWEKIADDSLAGVASWSRTGLGAFRRLRIVGFAKPANDGVAALVRTSSNNGTSYDAGASDYSIGVNYNITGSPMNSANNAYNAIYANWINQIGNAASAGISFDFILDQFNQNLFCKFQGSSNWKSTSAPATINTAMIIAGERASTSARNALQFGFSAGNIDFGHIALMGMRG